MVPLLLIAAASLLIVGLVSATSTGRRGCGQAAVMVMGAGLRTTPSNSAGTGGAAGRGGTGCRTASSQPGGGSR